MPKKVSATLPDDLYELLQELSEDTGRSLSSLIEMFTRVGAYNESEMRNKVEIYREKRAKRLAKGKGNGE